MSRDSPREFIRQLKLVWFPLLLEDGFKASGTIFRRRVGDMVQVVSLQGASGRPHSTLQQHSCVNIAAHLTYIPFDWGTNIDFETIKEYECEFRTRLSPTGLEDQWWPWGNIDVLTIKSARSLAQMYKLRGREILSEALTLEQRMLNVSVIDLKWRKFKFEPFRLGKGELSIARVALHHGNKTRAKEFAEAGIANCPERATTVRDNLLRVLEEASQ